VYCNTTKCKPLQTSGFPIKLVEVFGQLTSPKPKVHTDTAIFFKKKYNLADLAASVWAMHAITRLALAGILDIRHRFPAAICAIQREA
jgi:hypothetical protein